MEYKVSSDILDSLQDVIYESNIELLKLVHKIFLKDLDFSELKDILDGIKKKTFTTIKDLPSDVEDNLDLILDS